MSKKFETFRACPGCGQIISTSRARCDCGYILKQSGLKITGSVDAQLFAFVFFCGLILCALNLFSAKADLESANSEIESLENTILELESDLSLYRSKYDEVLDDYESMKEEYFSGGELVYISTSSNSYHSKSNCTHLGLYPSYALDKALAVANGYSSCIFCTGLEPLNITR